MEAKLVSNILGEMPNGICNDYCWKGSEHLVLMKNTTELGLNGWESIGEVRVFGRIRGVELGVDDGNFIASRV